MDTRYDLIFEGRIADSGSPEDARRNLAKLLRQEPDQVEVLFSGKPYVLRRALAPEAAYRYQGAMKHAGLVCRLVPSNEIAAVVKPSKPATTAGALSLDKKPASSQTASVSPDKKPANPALALDPLPSESAPASEPISTKPLAAPAALTECPKCHYPARGPQDGLISQGVCPACGLIIAKYLERQAELKRPKNRPVAAASESDEEPAKPNPNALHFDELPPGPLKLMSLEFTLPADITLPAHPERTPTASLKRRFLAAVATYFSLGFLMAGPILLGMVLLLVFLNIALDGADDLNSAMRMVNRFENYELIIEISLWLLGLWLGLIYVPSKWDGLTYGQRLMRIAPVRKNSDEVTLPDTGTLFQRLAGNIIAWLIWPVTLLWLLFDRSGRSIADRLSDCRQIEVGAVPDSPVLKALSPIAYGILLGLVAAVPLVWLVSCAENTVREIAEGKSSFSERMLGKGPFDSQKVQETLASRAAQKEEFGSPKAILERLVEFQRQYYARHQRYSEAIEELVMESPDRQSPMMLAMLMRQQLKIQLIGGGFKIGLRREDGWHIATEGGYQGVQPSF